MISVYTSQMKITETYTKQCAFSMIRMFVNSSAFLILLVISAVVILLFSFEQQTDVKRESKKKYVDLELQKIRRSEILTQFAVDVDKKETNELYGGDDEQQTAEGNDFYNFVKPMDSNSHMFRKTDQTEVRHVAFLKVHKTGSSTTQNLFLRFGVSRNLNFLLASVKNNECGGYPNCISFYNTLSDSNVIPSPNKRPYQILCSHVVYNRQAFQKYLPVDTKYISLVREPVKRLESAINFFNILNNTRLSTYANNPLRYDNAMLNNRMAFEFGFNQAWFPNMTKRALTDSEQTKVSDYIRELGKDFTLIMVNERYHESLVLMKRQLNWRTQDILYTKKLKRKHKIFKKEDVLKLKQFLYLDYMLYDFATEEIDRKISQAGEDFMDEVGEFAILNKLVNMFCNALKRTLKPLRPMFVEANKWHSQFEVDWHFCNSLRRGEISFLDEIRYRLHGTMNTS